MRVPSPLLLFLMAGLLGLFPARAQDNPVQTFTGSAPQTTPVFKVQDHWEIRWNAPSTISVTLLAPDGTVLAGSSGSAKGSLYQPKGGSYYLQIDGAAANGVAWSVNVVELGPAPQAGNAQDYTPPASISPPGAAAMAAAPSPAPPTATTTTAPPPAVTSTNTGQDLSRSIVIIKGDAAEGTGFLVKMPQGPAVITNLHVISANPNPHVFTTGGQEIDVIGIFGATDRDLALLTIKDNGYSYLTLNDDIQESVREGDPVTTPGNSEGGEVVLDTKGQVLGVGPDRVEVSNPIYHGNSGGPVIQDSTGRVLAVVTQAMKVNLSNDVDKASHDNKNSAITGDMRYFGLRIDTVPKWEPLEWNRFLTETTFLRNFHQVSRCLDSYLNGARYESVPGLVNADPESGAPSSRYYLRNDRLREDADNFHQVSGDADKSQKLDAQRELLLDLGSLADTDMESIENPSNFYSFDRIRAGQEVAYRKALKAEIDTISNKISDLGH